MKNSQYVSLFFAACYVFGAILVGSALIVNSGKTTSVAEQNVSVIKHEKQYVLNLDQTPTVYAYNERVDD